MSEKELKITDEQLEKIRAQVNVLLHALNNVMQKTKETADELEKEYGKININLEDGTYEVIKEEEVEEEK